MFSFADNALHPPGYPGIMERMAWTDERLEERFDGIDRRFDAIDQRFNRLEAEVLELRREMRAEIAALRVTVNRVGGGVMVGLLGVIAAILAKGG
jgi:hypothetical protein